MERSLGFLECVDQATLSRFGGTNSEPFRKNQHVTTIIVEHATLTMRPLFNYVMEKPLFIDQSPRNCTSSVL